MTPAQLDRFREDLAALGAPPEAIETAVDEILAGARLQSDQFPVHRDNVTAVKLFDALSTQWDCIGFSGLTSAQLVHVGLKYEAIEPTARMAGLELTPADFARLRLMENAAIAALAEQRR